MPPSVQGAVQVQTASSGPVSPKASASAASALIGSSDRHRARASKVANMRRLLRGIGFSFLAWAECLFPLESPTEKRHMPLWLHGVVSPLSSVLEFWGSCKVCFPFPGGNGAKSCTKMPRAAERHPGLAGFTPWGRRWGQSRLQGSRRSPAGRGPRR